MSLPDTPRLGERWCPGCSPGRDPTREILETSWCGEHQPPRDGPDDTRADTGRVLSGGAEVDGIDCAAMARLLR